MFQGKKTHGLFYNNKKNIVYENKLKLLTVINGVQATSESVRPHHNGRVLWWQDYMLTLVNNRIIIVYGHKIVDKMELR